VYSTFDFRLSRVITINIVVLGPWWLGSKGKSGICRPCIKTVEKGFKKYEILTIKSTFTNISDGYCQTCRCGSNKNTSEAATHRIKEKSTKPSCASQQHDTNRK
jgi:hypothetical protein